MHIHAINLAFAIDAGCLCYCYGFYFLQLNLTEHWPVDHTWSKGGRNKQVYDKEPNQCNFRGGHCLQPDPCEQSDQQVAWSTSSWPHEHQVLGHVCVSCILHQKVYSEDSEEVQCITSALHFCFDSWSRLVCKVDSHHWYTTEWIPLCKEVHLALDLPFDDPFSKQSAPAENRKLCAFFLCPVVGTWFRTSMRCTLL